MGHPESKISKPDAADLESYLVHHSHLIPEAVMETLFEASARLQSVKQLAMSARVAGGGSLAEHLPLCPRPRDEL